MLLAKEAHILARSSINAVEEWLLLPELPVENIMNESREMSTITVLVNMVPFLPRKVLTAYIAAKEPGTPANEIIT
jgi:hypothetical protein